MVGEGMKCRKATIDTMSLGMYAVSSALKEIAKAIRRSSLRLTSMTARTWG